MTRISLQSEEVDEGKEEEEEKEESVLEKFAADKELTPSYEETKLPKWLYKYLVYRFNLLDRTGENFFLCILLKQFFLRAFPCMRKIKIKMKIKFSYFL